MADDVQRLPRLPGSVKAVDPALDLLEALAATERSMGTGELAAMTGLPPAIVGKRVEFWRVGCCATRVVATTMRGPWEGFT